MKKLISISLCGALIAGPALAGSCTLPADTSTRIGRAQAFIYYIPNTAVLSGTRDYVWSAGPLSAALPTGVFASFYIPGWRGPADIYAPYAGYPLNGSTSYNIGWYQANHPSWVVYRPDTKTPAWLFCPQLDVNDCDVVANSGFGNTPLDITNAAVRTFIEAADVGHALGSTFFNGISVDNITFGNQFYNYGTCSVIPDTVGCVHAGGVFTPLYTAEPNNGGAIATLTAAASSGATTLSVAGSPFTAGWIINVRDVTSGAVVYSGEVETVTSGSFTIFPSLGVNLSANDIMEAVEDNNPTWVTAQENYLLALRTYVNGANGCLAANINWTASTTDWAAMTANLDLTYEEAGFSTDAPANCSAGGGYWTDSKWTNKFSEYATRNGPFVLQGSSCPTEAASREKNQYQLATLLLLNNAHSYNSTLYVSSGLFENYEPELYWNHGAASGPYSVSGGVYSRAFLNGLAIVNPFSTVPATYNLKSNVYHTSTGLQYTGVMPLAAPQGILLHNGASSAILTGKIN